MTEITLPQEVVDKVIQVMADDMLKNGLSYNLRTAVEDAIKQRILKSGIIDNVADAIITHVLDDQEAIVKNIGDEFIAIVGESLATVYKRVAQAIAEKVRW